MLKSQILPKLVLLNTRLVVGTYTALTLPLYTLKQRPWRAIRENKTKRVTMEKSKDGTYYWTRFGPEVIHPAGYHKMDSIQEIIAAMKKDEDPEVRKLGYREVHSEETQYDKNGRPLTQDGKILKKLKLSNEYNWLSSGDVFSRINNLTNGFSSFGIGKDTRTIIYADTRLEWFLSAITLLNLNATIVTLFANLGQEGLLHGMNQTEAKHIITSIDLLGKISKFADKIKHIEKIYFMRYDFQKNQELPKFPPHIQLIPFDEVDEVGKSAPPTKLTVTNQDDVSLIMYTSGTTGIPKAVILTGRQLKGALNALMSNVIDLVDDAPHHVYASFLPLAHILGFAFELFLFSGGVKIGYSSPHTLVDTAPAHIQGQPGDLRILQPTVLVTVPLILDRIVKEIYLKLSSRSPILPPLFNYLMDYKIRWKKRGYDTPIVNWLVCRRVREQFGGKLQFIVSGGAALNERTEEIIKAAMDVSLLQGYGCTETTGGVVGMSRKDLDSIGKAGYPFEGVRIKLDSWPEGGYTVDDKPNPRGEILAGGDSIAQGYYQLEDETKSAFSVDGEGIRWFHTGDIGEILQNGAIRVVDRKKDLAKLPNGEYISLGKIEAAIKTVPLVENICICLSVVHNDIVGLVTPNSKYLAILANDMGKANMTREQLCNDPEVKQAALEQIITMCQSSGLHRKEIPVKIELCPEEWLPDNNLLTAAFKLKRGNVIKYYKKQVDDLFKQIK